MRKKRSKTMCCRTLQRSGGQGLGVGGPPRPRPKEGVAVAVVHGDLVALVHPRSQLEHPRPAARRLLDKLGVRGLRKNKNKKSPKKVPKRMDPRFGHTKKTHDRIAQERHAAAPISIRWTLGTTWSASPIARHVLTCWVAPRRGTRGARRFQNNVDVAAASDCNRIAIKPQFQPPQAHQARNKERSHSAPGVGTGVRNNVAVAAHR